MEIRHLAVAIALLVTCYANKIGLGGNWYWFSVLVTKDRKIAKIYWW